MEGWEKLLSDTQKLNASNQPLQHKPRGLVPLDIAVFLELGLFFLVQQCWRRLDTWGPLPGHFPMNTQEVAVPKVAHALVCGKGACFLSFEIWALLVGLKFT